MSTDTAFALGVLALVAPRRARACACALLTLAVVDDLVALLVIATVYTRARRVVPLAIAAGLFGVAAARCATRRPTWRGPPAAGRSGVAVWVALYESGIDPVIAGLAVGLVTSAYPPARSDLERVDRADALVPRAAHARARALGPARRGVGDLAERAAPVPAAPVDELRDRARCSRSRTPASTSTRTCSATRSRSPITLGIVFGYVVGKPLGILAGGVARDAVAGSAGCAGR